MRETRGDLNFTNKPGRTESSTNFGFHYFDRNPATVFEIVGQINGAHSALTNKRKNLVVRKSLVDEGHYWYLVVSLLI
jgi:hypothetical protein